MVDNVVNTAAAPHIDAVIAGRLGQTVKVLFAAAVGLPVLVSKLGGDPAIIAAIGMLAGFCGTLLTPMAANFNIVPAALLELDDRNAVIKAPEATALPLLAINTFLIWGLAFR